MAIMLVERSDAPAANGSANGWSLEMRVLVCGGRDWQPMETAPKDGTTVLIRFVHSNAKYSKDPVAEGWIAAHEAKWIDHNGGGWTWHGLCGRPVAWCPLSPSAGIEVIEIQRGE